MRILFVTPYVPSMIRVRPLNFLKQLSERHEVTLVSLVTGDQAEEEAIECLRAYCEEVHPLHLSKAASCANCCKRLLTQMPLQAAYTEFEPGRQFLSKIARDRHFDVIHVEHIRGANLVSGIDGIPKIYDSVDCITRLLKQRLASERRMLSRALGYEELLKMRFYEARIADLFDRVIITSDVDRRALEYLIRHYAKGTKGGKRTAGPRGTFSIHNFGSAAFATGSRREHVDVSVIRNGVDSDYFSPVRTKSGRPEIVFSGKMSYFANVSAVQEFYHGAFSKIRAARPDARFTIVGSDPPDSVRGLQSDPAVKVTGYVPDIRPHLAAATVIVCPLSIGVGIQNKVLEAMSMGKPVVASPTACRGIPDAADGVHLVCGETADQMADSVLSLIDNPVRSARLGESARRLVTRSYSWKASGKALESIYEQTVDANIENIRCAA